MKYPTKNSRKSLDCTVALHQQGFWIESSLEPFCVEHVQGKCVQITHNMHIKVFGYSKWTPDVSMFLFVCVWFCNEVTRDYPQPFAPRKLV